MEAEKGPWQLRFERERKARKESEALLEKKSMELWTINQNLEAEVQERTESLEKALIKAEEAHKAKSSFLANMSHEVRTPLNAIIGFSKFLTDSTELGEKNKKYASIISTSATSLLDIINDILDFSKIESGNFSVSLESTNIVATCQNVSELFSSKAQEKLITLELDLDPKLPGAILSDSVRIRQVLANLLSNAIKFTPEEGKVSFKVDVLEQNAQEIQIKFCIIDTGIGIAQDDIAKVLQPFQQLEHIANKHQVGTGLGLSICNHILSLLDSKLEIESEEGKGSCFSFVLQTTLAKQEQNEVVPSSIEEKQLYQGHILLAEDNVPNQELMRVLLDELNVQFSIANNGEEALQSYMESSKVYDLILMDINMPKMDGITAFQKIRQYQQENGLDSIPVIALTANAIKGDKDRFLGLGMDGYLSKPINMDALQDVFAKYLKQTRKRAKSIDRSLMSKRLKITERIADMIVQKFESTIRSDVEELKHFIEHEELEQARDKAHYIKNTCLNVALDEACEYLEELERTHMQQTQMLELFEKFEKVILEYI